MLLDCEKERKQTKEAGSGSKNLTWVMVFLKSYYLSLGHHLCVRPSADSQESFQLFLDHSPGTCVEIIHIFRVLVFT